MADEVERLYVTLEANADKLIRDTDKAIKELERDLGRVGDKGEKSLDDIGKSAGGLTSIFGKLKAAAGAFIAVFATGAVLGFFKSIAGAVTQSNAQFETFRTQFETLLGSASAAQQRLDQLAQFGVETPFELSEVVNASRVLEVFGGATLATGDNLRMIGDIAAGVNQPFSDVAFWVGRMYDALKSGKPFGEAAARLQEMGALSGPVRTRLEEMQKAGADGAEIFAVFSEQVGGRFAGNMERLSQTFQGVMSNLVDFRDQLVRIGGEPLFEEIRDSAKGFLDIISEDQMSDALLAVAKSAGEAAANLTKIVSSGIIESLEDLDPETVQKFADALDDLGAALSEAAGTDLEVDLNLIIDALTIAIDAGTTATNVYNRFSGVLGIVGDVFGALKDALLAIIFPIKNVIDGFSNLNALVEQLTGKRLVDFSRDVAEASETSLQAAQNAAQAAQEIADLSAMGPGRQAPTTPEVEEDTGVDEEQQKLLDKLDGYAEDFIDATEERNEAIEELEAEHVEKVAEIEQDAIDDRIEVWEDLNKDLVDLEEESAEKRIEAAEKYQEGIEQLEEDTAEKRANIFRKAQEDLADLERDTDKKLADEREDFDQEEKRETEDHLNELRQIRQRYLQDLEGAVKSRDARAIVDLKKRFEQEKSETERDFETDQQRRREDRDERLQEIREEEAERSAEILRSREEELRQLGEQEAKKRQQLEESYNQQIAKINEQEARKRAELMTRAQEEIAQINESEAEKLAAETERFTERQTALEEMLAKRLETIAKSLSDEEEMNAESAQRVLESLNEVFGIGGDIDKLMEDFAKRRAQKLTVHLEFENGDGGDGGGGDGGGGGGRVFQHGTGDRPRLFTKPTQITVAEGGSPELVSVTPFHSIEAMANRHNATSAASQMAQEGGSTEPREMDLNVRLSGSAPPGINNGADRDALAGVMIEALRAAGFRAKGG